MILEISSNRRNEIKNIVYSALLHSAQLSIPVKIGTIIRSYSNIKMITYSSQVRKHGISYEELIISAETKDSYVVYCHSKNKYCIYYNDLDLNITSCNRVRWNLAHELGHVLLKHHKLCSKEKLLRGGFFLENIDDYNYKIAEIEANYFAQLILVPHAALLGFKIMNQKQLKDICQISDKAAKRRYYEFVEWKSHVNAQDEYDNHIFHLYYDFIYKRKCKKCDAGIIQRYGNYCPICGNKKTLEWGDGIMNYKEYETTVEGFLETCIRCGNKKIMGNYCQICGAPVRNYCTSYLDNEDPQQCRHSSPLPGNARYCPDCGSMSIFYQMDILNIWNIEYDQFMEEEAFEANIPTYSDGFMTIPDEPPAKLSLEDDIDEELPFN